MLALAIEFSRCPRIRTLKAEQCVLMIAAPPVTRSRPRAVLDVNVVAVSKE
jgi:hypothetical protein